MHNNTVKKIIANTTEYKVLSELKAKAIKVRIAKNDEETTQTGFNVLNQLYQTKPKSLLLDTLPIKSDVK